MRYASRFLACVLVGLITLRPVSFAAAQPPPTKVDKESVAPLLMAHYMPWFEAKPVSRQWGWHWTMNHYQPDSIVNNRREAASHYYPLMGLYDSNDPDALECQVLLMKFSGIGGVFIDWFGTDDFLDYGINHRNTLRMISLVKKAGLKFAVVYEDATVPKMIAAKRFSEADAVPHGKSMLEWVQKNWFSDPAYLKQEDRPVFLDFGAGYYHAEQWEQIFSGLPRLPKFFSEEERHQSAAGAFEWPQPGNGTDRAFKAMDQFYTLAMDWPAFIPAAFPRFHDIYAEAKVQNSWGKIEDRNGKTYTETLERALKSHAPVIQLVTWNDWGEGTQIEPSVEFGYRDLEATQRLYKTYADKAFPYSAQDLRLPIRLFALKKKIPTDDARRAGLDKISDLLFAGNLQEARTQLDTLPK